MRNRILQMLIACILAASVVTPALGAPSASPKPSAKTKVEEASASPTAKASKKKADDADSNEKKETESPSEKKKNNDKDDEASDAKRESGKEKEDAEEEIKDPSVYPELHAGAALLLDLNTGAVLYAENENKKMYPASTTKILTAILALEKGNLADTVIATEEAIEPITNEHSKLGILVGEEFTLEQLLYALLVSSANDAANVIAVHIGGSLDNFAEMLNARAQELGATGTHFTNAHGFHDDDHYTTASDLALFARHAMKNETFRELVAVKTHTLPPTNKHDEDRKISTTNHLISKYRNTKLFYQYANGIKTGNTDEAGNCLVASASKGNINLLSVVLGCENENTSDKAYSFTDTTALFDHVFENFQYHKLASAAEVLADSKVYEAKKRIRVTLGPKEDIEMILPNDTDVTKIQSETTLAEKIKAPIHQGDVLGKITYTLNGETLIETDLVALNDVKQDMIMHFINSILHFIFHPFVLIPVLAIAALLIYSEINRRKRRRRRRSRLTYTNRQNRREPDKYQRRRR